MTDIEDDALLQELDDITNTISAPHITPDLLSTSQMTLTEEIPGKTYVVHKTETDDWRTIKTDIPHPAGCWTVEILDFRKDNMYVGAIFVHKNASQPTLSLLRNLTTTWLGNKSVLPNDANDISCAGFDPCNSKWCYRVLQNAKARTDVTSCFAVGTHLPESCVAGDKLLFEWNPDIGVITLTLLSHDTNNVQSGKTKLGIFMSGLRDWNVYPAISMSFKNNATRWTFNVVQKSTLK